MKTIAATMYPTVQDNKYDIERIVYDGNWCDLGTNWLKYKTLVGTDRVRIGIGTKR